MCKKKSRGAESLLGQEYWSPSRCGEIGTRAPVIGEAKMVPQRSLVDDGDHTRVRRDAGLTLLAFSLPS